MKIRIIAIMVALTACGGLNAQYYNDYYHRTGDTIHYRSEIGYYMWWDSQRLINDNHNVVLSAASWSSPAVITPYFTNVPLKIVGIAGCPFAQPGTTEPYDDTTTVPEYFYLFGDNAGTPVFLNRVQWDNRVPSRYLEMDLTPKNPMIDSCCVFSHRNFYAELRELYFDSAIIVNDTFYIGMSFNCELLPFGIGMRPPTHVAYAAIHSFASQGAPCSELDTTFTGEYWGGDVSSSCYFPIFDYLICNDTTINSTPTATNLQWNQVQSRAFFLMYPIVEIDTTVPPFYLCDPVQNVQAIIDGDSCAIVTWDDFYHYTYCEVQWFASDQGYGTAQSQTVNGTNMLRICDLDSTKTYFIRVRAFCDTSKIETDWTQWVTLTFQHTEGISDDASMLSFYTHLLPNPATDRVTVSSSFGLTRIEVYNMQGLLVYSEPAGFSSTTVDLNGWASGQYIMMVHTPRGVTAKKLVVMR